MIVDALKINPFTDISIPLCQTDQNIWIQTISLHLWQEQNLKPEQHFVYLWLFIVQFHTHVYAYVSFIYMFVL